MLSVTQIELGLACQRKLAFKYWGKLWGFEPPAPDPLKPDSRPLGIEMHGIAEDYLNKGTQPDRLTQAGEMFIQGLQFLPPPKSGGVEGEFRFEFMGVEMGGLIDYWGPLANFGCNPSNGHEGGRYSKRVVVDHKTSKNPEKYGIWSKNGIPEHRRPNKKDASKTVVVEATIGFLQNPQSIVYSLYDLIRYREETADLRWIYYRSKRPFGAMCTDITLGKMEVLQAFAEIIMPIAPVIEELKRTQPNPMTLDPNPNACKDYGGCEWQTTCNLSPMQQFVSALSAAEVQPKPEGKPDVMTMDLVERAKADIARKKGISPEAVLPAMGATATAADIANPPEARTSPPAVIAAMASALPQKPAGGPPPGMLAKPGTPPSAANVNAPPAVAPVAQLPAPVQPAAPKAASVAASIDPKVLAIAAEELGEALKRFAARISK